MKGLVAIMLSCLLVSSVIGMTKQSSHVWVQVAKASHNCAAGQCCSETDPERASSCDCGPCDVSTPPATSPLTLPEASKALERPHVESEYILSTPVVFSSLNWSPPVPPPRP